MEAALSANGTVADARPSAAADELLEIKVAAARLKITVATYKRLHLADPAAWPAERIGVQWRVPAAFVASKTAWPR